MKRDWRLPALLACAAAMLFHHIHNAAFLRDYPNLPAWITAPKVYGAWILATSVGVGGYWLARRGQMIAGSALLVAYACYGLDGLVHYVLAPMAEHTLAMNFSIWLEAIAAAGLLAAIALRRSTQ